MSAESLPSLPQVLNHLTRVWAACGIPVHEHLRVGADPAALSWLAARVGTLPPELGELYARFGGDLPGRGRVFLGLRMLTLEELEAELDFFAEISQCPGTVVTSYRRTGRERLSLCSVRGVVLGRSAPGHRGDRPVQP